MVDRYVRTMAYHGAIVIWIGLLAGFPFGLVVMQRMPGEVRAWHMAHMEGILNGLLTFAAAALLPRLTLDERRIPVYAWCFIGTGYANVVASIIAALVRQRGLEMTLPVSNLFVFALFVVGVLAVLYGLYLVMRGSQEPPSA